MKKLLAFLMVLALLVSACLLTACGDDKSDKDDKKDTATTAAADGENKGEDNPADNNAPADDNKPADKTDLYTLVKNAMTKTDAYTTGEMTTTAIINGDIMGNKISTKTTMAVKMNGDKFGLTGNVKADQYGETYETDVEYYFDGSYIYVLMFGEGYKMPCTAEEFAEEYNEADTMFTDLPKALFDGLEGDGSNVVLTLDEATCEQLFGDIITELCYDIVGEDLNQVTTTNGKITLSVKNGELTTYKMEFSCAMGSGDATATYTYAQSIELSNMGGTVTITPPEGYEDFMLMDEG